MPSTRVRLFEVDPDLGALLTDDERAEARQLAVPVVTTDRYERDMTKLGDQGAFGALVLEGMVLRQLRIADQIGMRLHGPGDIVPLTEPAPPSLVVESSYDAVPDTRLAMLGREVLFAAHRWPALVAALQLRNAQQADRLAAQLVICQLPRVDQRLLSLLRLLADSWGRVTPAGIALPLKLTHEALGALIGARRPTVTLALGELAERGAIVRQSEGWLLLEPAPEPSDRVGRLRLPVGIEAAAHGWAEPLGPDGWRGRAGADAETETDAAANSAALDALQETIAKLGEQHAEKRSHFDQRMREYATVRERARATRARIAGERLMRHPRRSP